jgi:8-oxo-dGTP pyrophosphatase MutT (NUDIX family)
MTDPADLLRRSLPQSAATPYPPAVPGIDYSAVLVALWNNAGVWQLLFIRRGEGLADHRGQIAFPGGREEAEDSGPLQTALREAREEVGISAGQTDPLGILDPVDTSTGFRIWPVVCILRSPVVLAPAPPEVREAFWIPLSWLAEERRWKWETAPSGAGSSGRRAVFFEPYDGRTLWGATALITVNLLQILDPGKPS